MELKEIPLKDIKIIENIRLPRDKKEDVNLLKSIKDNGLLQPIGVKEDNIGYTLIWGSRRIDACKKLGWKTIPAVIFIGKEEELTEEEFFILNSTENLQRRNNSLVEIGRVCKILKKTMSNSEIAIKLGISRNMVDSALTEITRIPVKWQNKIKIMNNQKEKAGDIPINTANRISKIRGLTTKEKDILFETVSKEDFNLGDVYLMANLLRKGLSKTEALKEVSKYKYTSVKIFVDKNKLEEQIKKYGSETDFYINVLNNYLKDSNFAFKLLVDNK